MKEEKIANRQLLYILFMMRTTVVISFLPVLTSADAGQDAWLAAIFTFFGTVAIVLLVAGLGIRFPEQTAIQYGEQLLGPWLSKLPSLVLLWAFLVMSATDMRIYGELLTTGFLSETPISFVLFSMILTCAFGAREGVEVMGRMADIIFPLFVFMLVVSIVVPVQHFEFANLEPILARGLAPVGRALITPIAVGAQLLTLSILIPNLNAPRLAIKTALWAVAGAAFALLLVTIIVLGIMGPIFGASEVFPFYNLLRSIELSEFLQRVEAPIVFAWGFGVFIGVSTILYCGARGLAQLLHLADYRPLVFPMAVIQAAFALHAYEDIYQVLALFQPPVVGPLVLSWFLLTIVPHWFAYLYHKLRS
ncbi:MAG: GerAB/ArcD/ProY family transporter [bacterium]|jgi:spore germination protein KB